MSTPNSSRKLRYAMVGGGRDAFIGAVHRHAIALDGQCELVAGALSSNAEKARASGRDLFLAEARNHGDWQALLADELRRPAHERIDFVVIVTPNHVHFPVAQAFVEAGFHVVCDKPLVHTQAEADALVRAVARQGTVFGVTYNYSGYPMVRQARAMVRAGEIGEIRKVIVEYSQGWLATALEAGGNKQAGWRTDPAKSGAAGAIGDIGSHAENLVATVTGLEIAQLCADLGALVPGRALDDDANLLLRFSNGARGVLVASQINTGLENDLRLRVSGTLGTLDWRQEQPSELVHHPVDGPKRILTRGSPWLHAAAQRASRLPSGHPEGFIEAFANVYAGVVADIRARLEGVAADPLAADYPRVEDGARGVRFIERTVASAASAAKWTAW
ncbi:MULTISPECIES: Gfo/Idh/MocA family oxidoreductase [unclassified Variovorax]|uniref:Gfo/Idh/MocA family protein n=1 Tax=unclassified Variovorax TaxID=663243 RepID=UPI0025780513|nr:MULTISPECIES: Gfo/Idh/MocA family oxidoreductase [unclassified Variovorax]MDM0091324.1 Gfo/Idh/MocA family oxidoreductase [Variovorax sp. J22G40]MDM0149449.1 Gfo/Idh/MocA family oxidoreductase [Variovorax sp. J2P1-31]